jgi:DNA-binding transcriptional ArsR family regulator
MRREGSALLPILRSEHLARLLAELLLHPEEERSLTDLSRSLGVALSTIHQDAGRLVTAGIVSQRMVGRTRLLRANTASRLFRPLTDLLLVTYGPAAVVGDEFVNLPGLRSVHIFGSWAARYLGEPGPAPRDIDVLLVGKVSHLAAEAAARRAEERLRMPVNHVIATNRRWGDMTDALMAQIHASPLVTVIDRDAVSEGATAR